MPLSSPAAAIIGRKLYVVAGSPNGRSMPADMWVRNGTLRDHEKSCVLLQTTS